MADQNVQNTSTSQNGAAVGAMPLVENFNPVVTAGGGAGDLRSQMRAHNESVEKQIGAKQGESGEFEEEITDITPAADDEDSGDEPARKPPVADDAIDVEEVTEDAADAVKKEGEPAAPKVEETAGDEIEITDDLTFDAFAERKRAYLDTVEITPQLQAILDRQDVELEKALAAGAASSGDEYANQIVEALGKIYETEVIDGDVVPNVAPAVEAIRTLYKNEYPAFTTKIFESDSTKYAGMTVFEEKMFDELGATPEKLKHIVSYLESEDTAASLPVPPPPTPQGVDVKFAEAYREVGEAKRFEIESITSEIARLNAEMAETTEPYDKKQIADQLNDLQGKLNSEVGILARIQSGINSERQQQEVQVRQQSEAAQRVVAEVWTTHDTEMNRMLESFAQDLAPRLSFVEGETALSMSRNVLSRVNNALDFDVNDRMEFIPKGKADFFAKQLKDEGINFDFEAGRRLLYKSLQLTDKLTKQRAQNASPAAIARTQDQKAEVLKDIKVEQKALLGQISGNYVKSSNKKLTDTVKELNDKRVKARAVISKSNNNSTAQRSQNPRADIAAYNQQRASAIKNGDDLFNEYAEGDDE
ncbi:MAG TPA: hypothetical protein VNI84_12150 [Pyrinomonadaceae bacterium]|nr:hypothetical protein [Pyrinomonadaceae bacterium]